MSVAIARLSFEHHRLALGIGEASPRISWRFGGDALDWEQTSYDLEVRRGLGVGGTTAMTPYTVSSSASLLVPWPEAPLKSREQAQVRARAHGKTGQASTPWSDWVAVETGLLDNEWVRAKPIGAATPAPADKPKRPVYFRKQFSVEGAPAGSTSSEVLAARLYITALGLYKAEINGRRVGDHVLAPGFQSYHHHHVYDTYDVTALVRSGDNAIGVTVGEGWFAGRYMDFFGSQSNIWGQNIGVLALLTVTLANGTTVEIPTDLDWECNSKGPIITSEIYDGEVYDSRLEAEIEGWSSASFAKAGRWPAVRELPAPKGRLVPPDGPPVRKIEQRLPERVFQSPSGKTLVDFGQNLVGGVRLTVSGPSGTTITLRHAEVLDNGELGTRPLRSALQRDKVTLHGDGLQTWEPHFTFHGFRYVQVDGWPESSTTTLGPGSIRAIVVHSDMEATGSFKCSHELLSKFHENVRWSMKGNFLSIPTDCPQRDERAGWTGDAHAFGPTSNFLYDASGFWRGWHRDVWSEMQKDGGMVPPVVVPTVPFDGAVGNMPRTSAAVWGDVAVAGPYNLWMAYGDPVMLEEQLPQAANLLKTGVDRSDSSGPLWSRTSFQYGDWLDPLAPSGSPGLATTHRHLVADAYLVGMYGLLARMASALGRTADEQAALETRAETLAAFRSAWMTTTADDSSTGDYNSTTTTAMKDHTQTAYALALHFALYADEAERAQMASSLVSIVRANNHSVGTGFAGTPALAPTLQSVGATADFYAMLLKTTCPSWLYGVVMGGTTTWERWDSLLPDGSINPGEMTSFNHYAFGSVADWIHRTVGGLAPLEPGWKKIRIEPIPGGDITSAETTYVSGYGRVSARWRVDEASGNFSLVLDVPPNTRAVVKLPGSEAATEVGSGRHEFPPPPAGRAGVDGGKYNNGNGTSTNSGAGGFSGGAGDLPSPLRMAAAVAGAIGGVNYVGSF